MKPNPMIPVVWRAQTQFMNELKVRFQTTDQLNKAFGLTYWSNRIDNWDDFPDIRGTINGSLAAEFETIPTKAK